MLSRKHRFHGRRSLQAVYREGKTHRSEYFSVKVLKKTKSNYRSAVVVSKKVSKSAVVRNRIRRRIYEQLRGLVSPDSPHDIMVIVYSNEILNFSDSELSKQIKIQLKTANVAR